MKSSWILLALAVCCASARADELAVTIDDLPWVGPLGPGDTQAAANERILGALAKHRATATGFVVCDREGVPVLHRWLAAGHALGNHTSTHRAIDAVEAGDWEQDVVRCQGALDALPLEGTRWFRYPFLRTGKSPARRDEARATIARLGLREAPVSVDTSEWALAKPYVEALTRGDQALAATIGEAYVEHVARAVRRYREVGRARAGRPVKHVLLLHANALAADHLDALLTRLAGDGVVFIPLDEALADPVYAARDGYAGAVGASWLHRMEPAAMDAWAWDEGQREALERRFGADDKQGYRVGRTLSVRLVAPATWVATDAEPWPANSLVADMPDGSLLFVDTPYTPEGTRELLDWAEARFGRRRIRAINSHFHYDALGGNAALRDAGAAVIASDRTAALLDERLDAMQELVTSALAGRPEQAARFRGWRPAPPTQTFPLTEGITLDLGEPVRVLHPGPAHSPDNVVVHLPRRKVLFGGCMVLAGPRVANRSDADMPGWPSATRALQALAPSIVIPGHGDRTDPGLLDHTLRVLSEPAP